MTPAAAEVAATADMLARENKKLRAENKNMYAVMEENKRLRAVLDELELLGKQDRLATEMGLEGDD